MSEMQAKIILDINTHCLAEVLKYLSFEELMSLKKIAKGFHYAIATSLQLRVISLKSFGSMKETKAFFREMPFTLRKLDMTLGEIGESMGEASKIKYVSRVLKEVELRNVTHLTMEVPRDHRFIRRIMGRFRNVHSITLYSERIDEISVGLESLATATIEEMSLIAISPRELKVVNGFMNLNPQPQLYEVRDAANNFLTMLQKHGSRLRALELNGEFFTNDTAFNQLVIDVLAKSTPNLESFKLHSEYICLA